ncbi:DPH4 homolog [Biomphalaria glabrata]|uniref:DPH4 homolog n=1 Tax=Biomphalaria glabrata TaxID=6526 RepID=A0A9U8ED86_BIOGL|nr:DPH4 homolog [Biomphalaria glabrata]
MENLYEILNSRSGASMEEIKKSYISLVRLHHPDKKVQQQSHCSDMANSEMFIKIDRAWKILSDPKSRAQYDAMWHERSLVQDLPIQEMVDFKEFDLDEKLYTYPCRCGSLYVLTDVESQFHFDIVCCGTCSLTIKVIYSD